MVAGAAGLAAEAPRRLSHTAFGCKSSYVYAVYAEMGTAILSLNQPSLPFFLFWLSLWPLPRPFWAAACSRARWFLGSPKSTFSHHIVAMRAAAAARTGADAEGAATNQSTYWMAADTSRPAREATRVRRIAGARNT